MLTKNEKPTTLYERTYYSADLKRNGMGESGFDSSDSGSEKVVNSCEHGTEISVSINVRNRLTN